MTVPYLEVTFRRGRPLAAYLYLNRQPGEKSRYTRQVDPGLVIDYGEDDNPLGIEITAPSELTVEDLNRVLAELDLPPVDPPDLAPLRAA